MRSNKIENKDLRRIRHSVSRNVGICMQSEFYQQMPFFFTRECNTVNIVGNFRGCSCFLACGGPSLKEIDKEKLNSAGTLVCAVNNAGAVVRPDIWVSVDDPSHFATTLWLDPKVMKFVPLDHTEKQLWDSRNGNDRPLLIDNLPIFVGDCPNMHYFRRNSKYISEQFLWEDTINWGDNDKYGGGRSVMLAALRILFLLGIRKIFLLGVDFNMEEETPYAFGETKDKNGVKGNNETYSKMVERFKKLKDELDNVGLEVYNCNVNSGLKVFPYLAFDEALEDIISTVGDPKLEKIEGLYHGNFDEKQEALAKKSLNNE